MNRTKTNINPGGDSVKPDISREKLKRDQPERPKTKRSLKKTLFLFPLAIIFIISIHTQGCAGAQAGVSVSNVPLEGKSYDLLGTAETVLSWYSFDIGIIGIPFRGPPVDEACQELMQKKGGNALINIRYSTDRTILLFITRHRFFIKADVVKLK